MDLADFHGFVACGGFSYGDVLGAGCGWATSILERPALRDMFATFFARSGNVLAGRVQRLPDDGAAARIIPGAEHWPTFQRNASEQYEARLALLEVGESPSLFLRGMGGHADPGGGGARGEGRAVFDAGIDRSAVDVAVRFTSRAGGRSRCSTGQPERLAGRHRRRHQPRDGRATILMLHPERTLRTANFSWAPADWLEDRRRGCACSQRRAWLG